MCDKVETVKGFCYLGDEVMCDKVETVKGFCYLGDRMNARKRVEMEEIQECGRYCMEKGSFCRCKERHIKATVCEISYVI